MHNLHPLYEDEGDMGEIMLQNSKKIMWLRVDIYEALLKFEQVEEELNKVSSQLKNVLKKLHQQGLIAKSDWAQKPVGDRGRDDIDNSYSMLNIHDVLLFKVR